MNKPNILWLSLMAPYDKVGHAGGKIENYYLKYIHSLGKYNLRLLTFCKSNEIEKLDLDKYGIRNDVYLRKRNGFIPSIVRGIAWVSKGNIYNKYAGLTPCDISNGMKKMLHKLKKDKSYIPDIIIMQWTEILFMMPLIKKIYPMAKYIAIEEDVSFLGQLRRFEYSNNIFFKYFYKEKAERVKKLELEYLQQCDLVILNNRKDANLLKQSGCSSEQWVWTPYFQSNLNNIPYCKSKNIIFYGAMFREENWKSALWFCEKVLPLIKDEEVIFKIIGSNPNKKLLQIDNPRVKVEGFVDDILKELSSALCLVAPLVLGAGVKIKILEALSCGIPVLTNGIGIEGIPAINNESYFFCEEPKEYVKIIEELLHDAIDRKRLENNAKNVIRDNFDYVKDREYFDTYIMRLLEDDNKK